MKVQRYGFIWYYATYSTIFFKVAGKQFYRQRLKGIPSKVFRFVNKCAIFIAGSFPG